ncbi:hypothetical protein Cflav_PD2289 [Pedosphaera parvula Ellin514]|uniref:Uncharacterized protein n=1 Tax=Pedosphaera parvula (strain Ellin514) TaxID=320771 RepID=B9XL94_PEDPL|nr:hypothetical protein Cflav_PD2289 [Pedosphaera parvula Ellin514]
MLTGLFSALQNLLAGPICTEKDAKICIGYHMQYQIWLRGTVRGVHLIVASK